LAIDLSRTVEELENTLSYTELLEWYEYYYPDSVKKDKNLVNDVKNIFGR